MCILGGREQVESSIECRVNFVLACQVELGRRKWRGFCGGIMFDMVL